MTPENTRQTSIQPFDEMNRYPGFEDDWPSDEVFVPPRRTMANWWAKFHAARDCGRRSVYFLEHTSYRPTSERYEYKLYCSRCGYEIPEEEVLFVGGDWWNEHGWREYGRMLDDLFIPPERVLELGPDPDEAELKRALRLGRIERHARVNPIFRPDEGRHPCEDCGHEVHLLFDERCRMCYDGEWTGRMQNAVNALERAVRESHNNSFGHRLEHHVDPMTPGDGPGEGEVLWRRHVEEGTTRLVVVTKRLEDVDDGHREYTLEDPTYTAVWRYREEDVADCFWSTGLYDRHREGVGNDELREAYQHVCEHSFHTVHDRVDGELELAGEQCIHCRLRAGGDSA